MELTELPNTVVHCKTKDEFDRLMQIYQDAGWRWCNGTEPKNVMWGDGTRDNRVQHYVSIEKEFYFRESPTKWPASWHVTISLAEFLKEQGIETGELRAIPTKFAVYKQEGVDIQLWVRDGIAQIHKRGTKRKSFTVTGDTDQWVEIFFQGYCSAK